MWANIKKNWKTSLTGVMVLAATGAQVYGAISGDPTANAMNWTQVAQMLGQILAGGGLIVAKDSTVTGITTGQ